MLLQTFTFSICLCSFLVWKLFFYFEVHLNCSIGRHFVNMVTARRMGLAQNCNLVLRVSLSPTPGRVKRPWERIAKAGARCSWILKSEHHSPLPSPPLPLNIYIKASVFYFFLQGYFFISDWLRVTTLSTSLYTIGIVL